MKYVLLLALFHNETEAQRGCSGAALVPHGSAAHSRGSPNGHLPQAHTRCTPSTPGRELAVLRLTHLTNSGPLKLYVSLNVVWWIGLVDVLSMKENGKMVQSWEPLVCDFTNHCPIAVFQKERACLSFPEVTGHLHLLSCVRSFSHGSPGFSLRWGLGAFYPVTPSAVEKGLLEGRKRSSLFLLQGSPWRPCKRHKDSEAVAVSSLQPYN